MGVCASCGWRSSRSSRASARRGTTSRPAQINPVPRSCSTFDRSGSGGALVFRRITSGSGRGAGTPAASLVSTVASESTIAPLGHAVMHGPAFGSQPRQSSLSTAALPLTRYSAPFGQASTQAPQPVHRSARISITEIRMNHLLVHAGSPSAPLFAAQMCHCMPVPGRVSPMREAPTFPTLRARPR